MTFKQLKDKLSEKFNDADFKKQNYVRGPKKEKKEQTVRKASEAKIEEEKPKEPNVTPA